MKDTHEILSYWLDKWKRRLEKPRKLLFARSFVNVARAAAFSLENTYRANPAKKIERSATGWGRKLLGFLEDAYAANDPAIELLKLEYSNEVEELKRQLALSKFDLATIFPLLEKLKEGLSLTVATDALTSELLLGENADTTRIDGLTTLLLKVLLTKHGSNALEKLPQSSLARHGTASFLSQHFEAIVANKKMTAQLWQAIFDFWREEAVPEKITAALKDKPESVFDVFETFLWDNLMRELMREIAQNLAADLTLLASFITDKISLAEAFETNREKHEKLGLLAVQKYVRAFLQALFSKITTLAARRESSELSKSLVPLGDFLLSTANFDDCGMGTPNRRPNTVDLISTEAFSDACARVFSERLSENFNIQQETKMISDVGRRISTRFGLEIRESEIDWTSDGTAEIEMLCENFSARDVLHRELGLIVLSPPMNELLTRRIAEILKAVNIESLAEDNDLRHLFWDEWKTIFSQYSAHYSNIFDYLPWETMESADLKTLLVRVFADFAQPLEKWMAIAIIPNLKANGKIWRMSDVTFFDAAQFDFGEKRWFVHKFSDSATFAKLTVRASTPLEA